MDKFDLYVAKKGISEEAVEKFIELRTGGYTLEDTLLEINKTYNYFIGIPQGYYMERLLKEAKGLEIKNIQRKTIEDKGLISLVDFITKYRIKKNMAEKIYIKHYAEVKACKISKRKFFDEERAIEIYNKLYAAPEIKI